MKLAKKQKEFKLKVILTMLFVFCLTILGYNIFTLTLWQIDRNQIIEEMSELAEIIKIIKITPEEPELINPPNNEESDYWFFINFPLMSVNVDALREINTDTVGFISIAGTNINYPVVQTINNDFYLNHSFRRVSNRAGWIFMDYRNNPNFSDRNTIIYGHDRIDGTMFGTLSTILNSDWLNNRDNHIIRYSSPNKNMLFQVFSVYSIPVEIYYLQINFNNDEEYNRWLQTMMGRSEHDFSTTVDVNDKILTLSTCQGRNHRVVMHAKLIMVDRNN